MPLKSKSKDDLEVVGAGSNRLRNFSTSHIDEDLSAERFTGNHENELFFNCVFKDVRDLTLKNCDMNNSKFLTERPEEALGLTITMDCHTFDNVEVSPFLFDLMLLMLLKTKGNDAKRKAIVELMGKDRVVELLRKIKELER
jgi:hypothetical protein